VVLTIATFILEEQNTVTKFLSLQGQVLGGKGSTVNQFHYQK
jgi:hypothetical protein